MSTLPLLALALLVPQIAPAERDPRVTPEVLVVREAAPAVVYVAAERPIQAGFNPATGKLIKTWDVISGSGVVVEKSGYVITNHHVVGNDARKITIEFDPDLDGAVYHAEFVSSAPGEDLALLKIISEREFPVVRRGTSSDLMLGERVVAIGCPLRQKISVSTGVVSGLHRNVTIGKLRFNDLIQTDAAINQGNSGGPLLNILGELVGINTVVNEGAENMSFAIPVDRVEAVLREHLLVPAAARAWFGLDVDEEGGFTICNLVPGGPAESAGVELGDRLVAIDGLRLSESEQYRLRLLELVPGETALLTIEKPRGQTRQLEVRGWSRVDGVLFERLGATLAGFHYGRYHRVRLTATAAEGPARDLGLQPGDVIDTVRIGERGGTWSVVSPDDFAALVGGLAPGTTLTMDILRDADGSGRFEPDEVFRGSLTLR